MKKDLIDFGSLQNSRQTKASEITAAAYKVGDDSLTSSYLLTAEQAEALSFPASKGDKIELGFDLDEESYDISIHRGKKMEILESNLNDFRDIDRAIKSRGLLVMSTGEFNSFHRTVDMMLADMDSDRTD